MTPQNSPPSSSNRYDTSREEVPDSVAQCSDGGTPTLTRVYPIATFGVTELRPNRSLTLGRLAETADLAVDDQRVSRNHAEISWNSSTCTFQIADLKSANGTLVNGTRVSSSPLRHNDIVQVGTTLFVYQDADAMAASVHVAATIARSDLSVIILGETGVGKEVLSRRVHEWSGRSGPFVAVNCAALPKDLAAAELFGHVRGAYSGAHTNRAGIIASADRGTLLLDEIGELPLELQALLLRAVEERTVRPVGGDSERFVDVRFIAATNVALEAWATQGRFRSDLLARLQQVTLRIPALRERKTEILNLAAAFSAQCSRPLELSVSAALYLLGHAWPQNIRELKNVIVRFNALSGSGDCLTSDFLSRNLIPAPARQGLIRPSTEPEPEPEPEEDLEGPERQPIDRVALEQRLRQLGGNVAQLARELRTSRAHIYRLLRRYGIDIGAAR